MSRSERSGTAGPIGRTSETPIENSGASAALDRGVDRRRRSSRPHCTILSIPDATHEKNPYLRLLYAALSAHGCDYVQGVSVASLEGREPLPAADWLHIHWPEHVARAIVPAISRRAYARVPGLWRVDGWLFDLFPRLKLRRLKAFLEEVRARGTRICWTVHNLQAHDRAGSLEHRAYQLVCGAADLKVFHSRSAVLAFQRTHGQPGRHVIMPHGNYADAFPSPRPVAEVRQQLGLSMDRPVFGLIGELRSNKGVETVLAGARQSRGAFQVLLAGRCASSRHSARLIQACRENGGIRYREGRLSDADYADYVTACDGILLPYSACTTSGALMAAITLGRGVIVSDLPALTEVLEEQPLAGVVMGDGDAVNSLESAIARFMTQPPTRRGAAALELASRYDWPTVVQPLAAALGEPGRLGGR